MYSFEYIIMGKLFRVLYECFPRTLRTPLISPYSPYSPNTSNELNTSNLSGFPISLKKLILTRCNARGGRESNQSKRSNCSGSYKSRTLGIFGMDRKGRIA